MVYGLGFFARIVGISKEVWLGGPGSGLGSTWADWTSIGLVPVWAMVVVGHVGEVLVEVAEFSIFMDTLLSDCSFLVHNLYVVKKAVNETTNIPIPIITHT